MNDSVISIQALRKSFGTHEVLTGVDLEIPRGSVIGLLGANGAGKTTLLNCCLGLIRSWSGSIACLGEDPRSLSTEAKHRLGYVAQPPQFHAWMRVTQLIAYTAAFYHSWDHALVAKLGQHWELPLAQKVGTLSPGQLQKLAIVLALGHRPELLILDEPAANLDPMARRSLLEQVVGIAIEGGRTVVFSTHICSDLERVADRVAVLAGGRCRYSGDLAELKDSVKRLRIRSTQPLPSGARPDEALSWQPQDSCSALSTVYGPIAEICARLRKQLQAEVTVEDLGLEDIFIALHQSEQGGVECSLAGARSC